jgi:glycosyltransferase involved in cell wall biosynthesis
VNAAERKIIRFAACATHPIQYHAPVWRRLAQEPGIEFHAYFGSDMSIRGYRDSGFGARVRWDVPLTAGYEHTFLSVDPRIQEVSAWTPSARGLGAHFERFRPDVVLLTAYGGRFHLEAWRAAHAVGAKVLMRHEASDVAVSRSPIRGAMRDFFLHQLYSHIDGFAVVGAEARRHLIRLGVPDSKLGSAPYCVDTDFFAGEVARWMPQREAIRAEWNIGPADIALVFSGKLIPKKDPLLIPAALRLLDPLLRERVHLIVAGDGALRTEMENVCRDVLGAQAHFPGFLNQSEIGRVYAAGDLLVLPSRRGAGETWGLVVNEAMQFGLTALVSNGVGCAPDLISADTGSVFASGDAVALAKGITDWSSRPRESTARAAQAQVAGFSAQAAAGGLLDLTKRALEWPCR